MLCRTVLGVSPAQISKRSGSQRNRVQSHVLSRAEKRKKLHDIQKAETLHRADVDESLRSHQHLLKEKTTITRSTSIDHAANRAAEQQRPSSGK